MYEPQDVLDGTVSWLVAVDDCLETLRWMPDNSVDAIVTDPPYGLKFMNRRWDYDVPSVEIWHEALRVLKPGGHLLAFFGTRTYHRGVVRIEDAGFEIRDMIEWYYFSGFPKSLDPLKTSIGTYRGANRERWRWFRRQRGTGTGLKPSHEPIVLARKPLDGTVAGSVLKYGTGALNITACRVGTGGGGTHCDNRDENGKCYGHDGEWGTVHSEESAGTRGRWPPNAILTHHPDCADGIHADECVDGCPVLEMGQQSGSVGGASPVTGNEPSAAVEPGAITGQRGRVPSVCYDDSGTGDRFFPTFRYVAKPSKAEKIAGVTPRKVSGGEATGRKDGSAGVRNPRAGAGRTGAEAPMHPTTKPIDIMRWLVKLVTPENGIVLDPFCGSGTTGIAALLEGFRFLGCELDPEYAVLAEERITWWEALDPEVVTEDSKTLTLTKPEYRTRELVQAAKKKQGSLFDG